MSYSPGFTVNGQRTVSISIRTWTVTLLGTKGSGDGVGLTGCSRWQLGGEIG